MVRGLTFKRVPISLAVILRARRAALKAAAASVLFGDRGIKGPSRGNGKGLSGGIGFRLDPTRCASLSFECEVVSIFKT